MEGNQEINPNYVAPAEPALLVFTEKDRGSEAPSGHEEKVGTASFGRLSRGSTFIARRRFIVQGNVLLCTADAIGLAGSLMHLVTKLVSLERTVET